jgi:nucleotide-binding universal stress UspA family protein
VCRGGTIVDDAQVALQRRLIRSAFQYPEEKRMASSIGQILVHLDSTRASSTRLSVARQLARQQDAVLAALYAVTPVAIASTYIGAGGGMLMANLLALDEERRDRAKMAFDTSMQQPGAKAAWSDLTEFSAIGLFARQALYADLLVLGQNDAAGTEPPDVPPDFIESVLGASGKPAIIVPSIGTRRDIGGTVLVAWKETAESARALAVAMPFLQRARKVHVASWTADAPPVGGASLTIKSYLRAHGVEPVWHQYGDEPSHLGELLLSTAFDLDADLLVMGCYGHSRAREWMLGGVSRTVLESMTLPVLMTH